MEGKPTRIKIKNTVYRIQPIPRKLICGKMALTLSEVLNRKGGLIVGEGDTGKTTYVQMLYEAAKAHDRREPILVKLRTRPQQLEIPDVPEGEVQTIIWDGLDEFPECARDIVDLTDDLDPERYHVWVTSRPCNAASIVAASRLLELVHQLAPFNRSDIYKIARSINLDGEAFISHVFEAHLESFIAKPGGALILMQLFANGTLKPSDDAAHLMNTAVMETIMRDFARETRDGDAKAVPTLTYAEQEIVEATCWVAACLVFSGRDAIWTGPEANCPDNDICLGDLPPRNFGTDLFKAALGLRLFEPLSPTRYRLAYSEMPPFLAGRWLASNFPVAKLKELPLYPAPAALRSQSLEAIAWASAYDLSFSKLYFLDYPSKFLKFHSLIEEVGFDKFFRALCKELFGDDEDFDPRKPHWFDLNPVRDLAGYTAFEKFVLNVFDSNTTDCRYTCYASVFLSACKLKPSQFYNTSASSENSDELIDIPTERELAQCLSNPSDVDRDNVLEWINAEKIRGFPYISLRKFFDTVVFRLQGDSEPLVLPKMAACALVYDAGKYREHVVKRLPRDVDYGPQIQRIIAHAYNIDEKDFSEKIDEMFALLSMPLSPAQLDALAPFEPKPVSSFVEGMTETVREELAQTVVEKIKNKGGRPKKTAGAIRYSQSEIAAMFGRPCTENTVANWERYNRTNGKVGAKPPSATYNGQAVYYSSSLRKNCGGENHGILRALIDTYKSTTAVRQRLTDAKMIHPKSEESLHRLRHPDGKARTQNPDGT